MGSDQYKSSTRKSRKFNFGFRRSLLSGVFILGPFTVTLLILLWLFGQIRRLIRPLVAQILSIVMNLPGVGDVPQIYLRILVFCTTILMLSVIIYLIGLIGTHVMGKRLITLIEGFIKRIPFAGSVYGASKQVVEAFGVADKPAYKSVVLIEFPRAGCKSLGFLTGFVMLNGNNPYAKVIIPTAPNPTTGFFELFPIDQVEEVDLTVEEAFKMILSVGLVAPMRMNTSATRAE